MFLYLAAHIGRFTFGIGQMDKPEEKIDEQSQIDKALEALGTLDKITMGVNFSGLVRKDYIIIQNCFNVIDEVLKSAVVIDEGKAEVKKNGE